MMQTLAQPGAHAQVTAGTAEGHGITLPGSPHGSAGRSAADAGRIAAAPRRAAADRGRYRSGCGVPAAPVGCRYQAAHAVPAVALRRPAAGSPAARRAGSNGVFIRLRGERFNLQRVTVAQKPAACRLLNIRRRRAADTVKQRLKTPASPCVTRGAGEQRSDLRRGLVAVTEQIQRIIFHLIQAFGAASLLKGSAALHSADCVPAPPAFVLQPRSR